MTLKIEQIQSRVRLCGEFRSEHLDQVKAEIELCESPAVLDLEELNLIDVEAVRFLNACEAKGISVLHCSPYISEWMLQERSRPEAGARKRKKGRGASEDEHGGAPIEG
jgi:aryl-alcohol dehydrogenase-like predicted oxidoreductase